MDDLSTNDLSAPKSSRNIPIYKTNHSSVGKHVDNLKFSLYEAKTAPSSFLGRLSERLVTSLTWLNSNPDIAQKHKTP